jgi:O-antigen/teichoic acid export membrane protein
MRILSNLRLAVGQQIYIFILNIVIGVLIARDLGPTLLGVFVAIQIISSNAEIFGRPKVDIGAMSYYGNHNYQNKNILQNINLIGLIASLIPVIAIFILHNIFIEAVINEEIILPYRLILILILIQIPLQGLYLNYIYYLNSWNEINFYIRVTNIREMSYMLMVVILIITSNVRIEFLLACIVLSLVFSLSYAIFITKIIPLIGFKYDRYFCKELLRKSLMLYLNGLIYHAQENSQKILFTIVLSFKEIAFVNQGSNLAKLLYKIPDTASIALYPEFVREGKDKYEIALKAFRQILIIGFLAVVFLEFFGHKLIEILYGDIYLQSADLLMVFLPGAYMYSLASLLISFINVNCPSLRLIKIQSFFFLFSTPIIAYCVIYFGMYGGVISASISQIIFSFFMIKVFLENYDISWYRLIPKRNDIIQIFYAISSRLGQK